MSECINFVIKENGKYVAGYYSRKYGYTGSAIHVIRETIKAIDGGVEPVEALRGTIFAMENHYVSKVAAMFAPKVEVTLDADIGDDYFSTADEYAIIDVDSREVNMMIYYEVEDASNTEVEGFSGDEDYGPEIDITKLYKQPDVVTFENIPRLYDKLFDLNEQEIIQLKIFDKHYHFIS